MSITNIPRVGTRIPAWALTLGKKLSRRVMLRHDYMPYEFTLIIYSDDTISSRNVFNATEKAGR